MQRYSSFHNAYLRILRDLIECDTEIAPRGQKTKEILNYSFSVTNSQTDVRWETTGTPERKEVADKYWDKELKWYLSGSLNVEDTPAKFWKTIADDNGLVTSNYGYLALLEEKYEDYGGESINPIERIMEVFKWDKDSRQAIIHYGESRHFWAGNKDTPCCVNNQFFIRDGKLKMIVNMRSNDAILGLQYDWRWFTYLHKLIGEKLEVPLGELYYNIASLHLYERDYETAKKIVS